MEKGATVMVQIGPRARLVCAFERRDVCRGENCGADILWLRTPAGKWMPVDAVAPEDEDHTELFQPHWAACPDRARFTRQPSGEAKA